MTRMNSSSLHCSSMRKRRSEVGSLRDRHMVVEQIHVVLSADILDKRHSRALVAYVGRPSLIERVRTVHRNLHFQSLPAVDETPALDDVQLLGVRRAEGVD